MADILRKILVIIITTIYSYDSIMLILKKKNVMVPTVKYDIVFLLLYLYDGDIKSLIIGAVVFITINIVRYLSRYNTYYIYNITNQNISDINLILNKHLKEGNNIEVTNKKNTIVLNGSRPKIKELKAMFSEIDYYINGNGTVSLKSMVACVVTVSMSLYLITLII